MNNYLEEGIALEPFGEFLSEVSPNQNDICELYTYIRHTGVKI